MQLMKTLTKAGLILILFLAFTITLSAQKKSTEFPKLTGPYLGQKTPGDIPELFAPGIVSTGYFEHSALVFTPDIKEMYWSIFINENGKTVSRPAYYMKMVDGVWNRPKILSFGNKFLYNEWPFISPDGKKLFFAAIDTLQSTNYDIYYVNRIADDWGEPIKLNESVNSANYNETSPSVSENGTIYFSGFFEEAKYKGGIYYSKLENGTWPLPKLTFFSRTGLTNGDPYISPDESYIIFNSIRDGGFGGSDLYICFKQSNGEWGKEIKMGNKINTEAMERFPNVTPDGKYLFFMSTRLIKDADANSPGNGNGDIYWVSASIIDDLRKEALKDDK